MSSAAEISPNNLELRKLSVHANPPDVNQFMNSSNFDNPTSKDNAIQSTSSNQDKIGLNDDEEFQPKLLPESPFYNLKTDFDESGPPTEKTRRLSPKTVGEISRFERHTILFSAMVCPSRSRVSSPVRRLLKNREPSTSCFQPSTRANEDGLTHDIESQLAFHRTKKFLKRIFQSIQFFRGYEFARKEHNERNKGSHICGNLFSIST